MTTPTAPSYAVHRPTAAGTYAQRFGGTVATPDGWTAYSGDRAGAVAYARAMNARLASEAR